MLRFYVCYSVEHYQNTMFIKAFFKKKVVLEALKGRETIQETASKYELYPNQITSWKKQFLEDADQVFSDDKSAAELKKAKSERDELSIMPI